MSFRPELIADALAETLRAHDQSLREEQSVYGLDALSETELHAVIARGLAPGAWGVLREQPYPHEWVRKLRPGKSGLDLPIPRDRLRCDFVITPEPDQTLADALVEEKQRRADEAEVAGTLFESLSRSHLAPGATAVTSDIQPPTSVVAPEQVFWLELKLIAQFCFNSGLPGPNRTYTSELARNPIADLKKLADDHRIHHAGVALIVFTEGEGTASHDLAVLAHRTLDRDIPIGAPIVRSFPIPDRIGNTTCTVALMALKKE